MKLHRNDEAVMRDCLPGLSRHAVTGGRELLRTSQIKVLDYLSEEFLVVEVRTPRDLAVIDFEFDCDSCYMECTCESADDCEHAFIALTKLLHHEGNEPSKSTPKPASPAKAKASRPDQAFADEIAGKLGRLLNNSERALVAKIHSLWTRFAQSSRVANWEISEIIGESSYWSWQMEVLWDRPPASAWEAWLYLANYIASQKKPLPAFLAQITPREEVERLVGAWKRRILAEQWRNSIESYLSRAVGETRTVELRAVFDKSELLLEWRDQGASESPFKVFKSSIRSQLESDLVSGHANFDPVSIAVWNAFRIAGMQEHKLAYSSALATARQLLRNPLFEGRVFGPARNPLQRSATKLAWKVAEPDSPDGDYVFSLVTEAGEDPPPALVVLDGRPGLYVTAEAFFETPPIGILQGAKPANIPASVVETEDGVALFSAVQAALPPKLAQRTDDVSARVIVECNVVFDDYIRAEVLEVKARADLGSRRPPEEYGSAGWKPVRDARKSKTKQERFFRVDRSALGHAERALAELKLNWGGTGVFRRQVGKKFPAEFTAWCDALPPGIDLQLDPLLASLRDDPISAKVRLDVSEAAIDWFDLQVSLDVDDLDLTKEELDLLLAAEGGFVRLGNKGWRRLSFHISPEDEQALAEAGLDARDFNGEKHRLHALQLAGKSTERLLPREQAQAVRRRVEEIQARVAPDVPAGIRAELRPYQIEGFHFLAYLSTNRFGGVLADDMGLGKTLQSLAWLAWLRGNSEAPPLPSLVVCPKSVVLNWQAEAARFLPGLRVKVLSKGACDAAALQEARDTSDLVVINYAQLRLLETELTSVPWLAALLDEAQFIKNPDSQTTRAAVQLKAEHRLALTGTPIENRLLDLWSIMSFAMPGALGQRSRFQKSFDQRKDPFARQRLASRVRPFVLRRGKSQVAKDLPERSEEDLLCEMEGAQAKFYNAELKRARQMLLKIKTAKELDRSRFNILTSLLRLRQICCHPILANPKASPSFEEGAKVVALLDLLEPLMEEGHKVLVFSQFTGMLDLIQSAIRECGWPDFLLTGETEDRQSLVDRFQSMQGSAVFLISLRAGGFGLNLTAASYVVLFDPWWNPAVENQAIDRTHRIGQTNKVNAYRLVVRNSIEEKIRQLQTQKRALAADVLGEEAFARTLTLDDFKYLLTDDAE